MGGNEKQTLLVAKELLENDISVTVLTERYSTELKRFEVIQKIPVFRVSTVNTLLESIKELFGVTNIWRRAKDNQYSNGLNIKSKIAIYIRAGLIKAYIAIAESSLILRIILFIIYNRNKYDIIYAQQINSVAYAAALSAKLFGKKVIVKDATLDGLGALKGANPLSQYYYNTIVKYSYFIAVSDQIEQNLIEKHHIPRDRVTNIPNSVSLYEKFMISLDYKTIVYVGNYWQGPIKGLDVLINAMPKVVAYDKDITLLVIGDGDSTPYHDIICDKRMKNNIQYLGKIEDVDKYYRNASVFVLPSRSEGMSNALLEAMAFGLPCIGTNISGTNQLINNKITGILIDNENYEQLADAIIFMFNNKKAAIEMGRMARRFIEDNYDIKKIVLKYIQLYKNILFK